MIKTSVCLSVCLSVRVLQVTVFDLGTFEGPFSAISEYFLLYPLYVRVTSHTDPLTNLIFGTESLYDTIRLGFNDFRKFAFLPLLGALLF